MRTLEEIEGEVDQYDNWTEKDCRSWTAAQIEIHKIRALREIAEELRLSRDKCFTCGNTLDRACTASYCEAGGRFFKNSDWKCKNCGKDGRLLYNYTNDLCFDCEKL
jgi:hypothetical protein